MKAVLDCSISKARASFSPCRCSGASRYELPHGVLLIFGFCTQSNTRQRQSQTRNSSWTGQCFPAETGASYGLTRRSSTEQQSRVIPLLAEPRVGTLAHRHVQIELTLQKHWQALAWLQGTEILSICNVASIITVVPYGMSEDESKAMHAR